MRKDEPDKRSRTKSKTLRYKLLMVFTLLVVVAWSVAWFAAATVVDRQAEKLEHQAVARGFVGDCVNRSVTGFPFRIEIRCDRGSRVGNGVAVATIEALTAAALVYNPRRAIVELGGPVTVSANGFDDLTADWSLARASARITLTTGLTRFDAEVEDASVVVGDRAPATVGKLAVNARQNPATPAALDVAVRLDGLRPTEGAMPARLAFNGTLSDGAPLLSGAARPVLAALLTDGLTLDLRGASFESGPMSVAASGMLTLTPAGLFNGTIDVALAGYDEGLPYIDAVAPEAEATVVSVLANILAFAPETTIGDRAAKKLTLTVSDGRVRAGFVPLFTIPRVALVR
ncbi:MAG: DUF2125 domain-containing protein [Pseudomonadota bacterium]